MLTIPCGSAHASMSATYAHIGGAQSLSTPFAQWLSQTRQRRGLSIEALAKKSGISTASISFYEKDTRSPKRETIRHLADALEVPRAAGLRAAGMVPSAEEEIQEMSFGQVTPKGRRIVAYDEFGNPADLSDESLYRLDFEFDLTRERRQDTP